MSKNEFKFDVEKMIYNGQIWTTISPFTEVLWMSMLDVQ